MPGPTASTCLLELAPEARIIVCPQDQAQIARSIEVPHHKAILLDCIDGLADYDWLGGANALLGKGKVIGAR